MESARARYPGAQPFSDDELSRNMFFGRNGETRALTDQIAANRLVVVYAKSGLGKTSLLQAGIAERLREAGYIPLIVRVNDVKRGPIRSILGGIESASKRQDIEYKAGVDISLWHFFKTAEFWRGDFLLTPVLILDQFEELFTLYPISQRESFLKELGHLVRGTRPALPESRALSDGGEPSDSAPEMQILISLREDYLGALEEAADSIPQILDHRFRLSPLSTAAAAEAMQRPAEVKDARLGTKPFAYNPATSRAILDYLSQRAKTSGIRSTAYVEPFHLQLVCQRVEVLVADRQRRGEADVEVSFEELGGENGLERTLRAFYRTVLRSIGTRRERRKVRRLCEDYLISPEGRRLSLDEHEIRRILRIQQATLRSLVDIRLLRSDQRADSWYYEISHDSLVAPILATRRLAGIAVGALGLLGSLFTGLMAVSFVGGGTFFVYQAMTNPDYEAAAKAAPVLLGLSFALLAGAARLARRSVETLNRYVRPVK